MIAEIGHIALITAFVLALIQGSLPIVGAARLDQGHSDFGWSALAAPAALAQAFCVVLSFGSLMWLFMVSDFTVALVAAHSNAHMPDLYRVSATWGNHEGSMVLWVLILALYGAGLAVLGGRLPDGLRVRALAVQGLIGAGFLAFILWTSNPFMRLDPAPFDGADLNPLLQHPALAFHPPFLYLGYVGLSMAYAFAVAALIEGRVDPAWARWVRPWTLVAWCALTTGIAMGSWWAYYELGWGGFWFWDPVENASLAPWLLATALLHSCAVSEKRGALGRWTVLLAILAFCLSIIGAFLVRSGVLTSVHAFANDPERGVFILAFLLIAGGAALALYAWRAPGLAEGGLFAPISREGALLLNNLFMATAAGAVLLGTLYPLLLDALGADKISVGPPYFNAVFAPLLFVMAVAMAVGPLLAWKRGNLAVALRRLGWVCGVSLAVVWVVWWLADGGSVMALSVGAAGFWLVASAISQWLRRVWYPGSGWRQSIRRAWGMPGSAHGMTLAHAGLGVVVLGIAGTGVESQESVQHQALGETVIVADYAVTLRDVEPRMGPNYRSMTALMDVHHDGVLVSRLEPEKRIYVVSGRPTTESAVFSSLVGDLYVSLGEPDPQNEGAWTTRIRYNPLAGWLWIGATIMAVGGLISLGDRRHRVGAPARRPAAIA